MSTNTKNNDTEDFLNMFPNFAKELLEYCHGDVSKATTLAENYCGTYESINEYVEGHVPDRENISDWLWHSSNNLLTIDAPHNNIHVFKE